MDLYCVMGNPVEHSRSPWIQARFAELTGQALDYRRRLVPRSTPAPMPAATAEAATWPPWSSSTVPTTSCATWQTA